MEVKVLIANIINILKSKNKEAKVYSILYDGRSGSVFLQSLLDSHPRIINFPATVLMGGLTGQHINDFLNESGPNNWSEFIERFVIAYPTLFDSRVDSSGMRLNELGVDRNQYIAVNSKEFIDLMGVISKEIDFSKRIAFLAIHYVWEYVRIKLIDGDPIIVYAMHTPEDTMGTVMQLFPEMKVLLATREPKSTLASYYNHHIKRFEFEDSENNFWGIEGNLSYPLRIIEYFINSYSTIDKYIEPDSVRVVRLEDLHYEPKITMKRISDWMGINFDDCLLESTFGGLLHWGDITIDYKTGPAYKPLEFDWRKSYYWSDAIMIESIFSHRYENYGYQKDLEISIISKGDLKIINTLINLFPMRWEVQAISSYLLKDESEMYQELKSQIYDYEVNLSMLIKPWKLKKLFKVKSNQNTQIISFLNLVKRRQKVINEYIKKSKFEKRYKLI